MAVSGLHGVGLLLGEFLNVLFERFMNACIFSMETAPPDPAHPRIVSKLLTLEYSSKICRQVRRSWFAQ
jgi:hypothetical protein